MPRRLAHAARSAYEVVDRGLVLLALVWQALWIAGDSRLWPSSQTSPAAVAAIWLIAVSWLVLLAWRLTDARILKWTARWANVVALSAAAAAMLTETATETPADWGGASGLAVLSTSVAGLVLGTSSAVVWVVAVVLGEAAVIVGLGLGNPALSAMPDDLLYPLYAVAVAAVMISARVVLTRDARRADRASADLFAEEQSRLTAQGVEAALHRQERLLHETVLNTLTAIVRGGITETAELRHRLVTRCRESVEVLRQLGRPPEQAEPRPAQRLQRDLQAPLVELQAMGTTARVEGEDLTGLPADVYDAVRTAAREALSNVSRHADARHVIVTTRRTPDGGVVVEIRDDGRGFVQGAAAPGFGVRHSVIEGMKEVGGQASVSSVPREGTIVTLTWHAPTPLAAGPPRPSIAASAFAIPLLVSFGLFNLAVVIITSDDEVDPGRTVVAFALFIALAVLMAWASRRGTIPWWVVITTIVGGAIVYHLQASAVSGTHGPWTDWASGAIIALFVVVAGAGPGWAWLFALAGWLAIQGDVLHEIFASGTAIIISAALFGRNIRRNEAIVEKARIQSLQESTDRAVAEEGSRRVRRRYEALRVSGAIALLEGIADGELDPDGEGVRRWADLEERYIRTVMRVDPTIDEVHALAVELASTARDVGVFLDVDLAPDALGSRVAGPGDAMSLRWAIENSLPGGVSRLSVRTEGEYDVVRLLAPIPVARHGQAASLPLPGHVLDPADSDVLWEIRGARGETDARAAVPAAHPAGDRR